MRKMKIETKKNNRNNGKKRKHVSVKMNDARTINA